MRRIPWLSLSAVLVLLDRVTKWWALRSLPLEQPQNLIGNSIRLTRVHNVGGAFGVFPGSGSLFIGVSVAISIILLVLLLSGRLRGWLLQTGVSIVLAGALGNLIDRLTYGYVLDFFEIRGFPIFNLADTCITIGAILIVIPILFGGERDRSSRKTDCT